MKTKLSLIATLVGAVAALLTAPVLAQYGIRPYEEYGPEAVHYYFVEEQLRQHSQTPAWTGSYVPDSVRNLKVVEANYDGSVAVFQADYSYRLFGDRYGDTVYITATSGRRMCIAYKEENQSCDLSGRKVGISTKDLGTIVAGTVFLCAVDKCPE